ncbi:hypothetical protein BCE_1494 [Bacillus cereus ATCC 10987]|uniref:Uncharacterized protein n=1 Tax=Bacillus cereus (strain ATCC 10987 / NRS 248) TaxID=222523 RepID=Q73BC5_BACC1|nr:hypothetical protein BCE_1494 [Bacillus cereus ATCC 10987]
MPRGRSKERSETEEKYRTLKNAMLHSFLLLT